MKQLLVIIQQIHKLLSILNSYTQEEREELLVGYQLFLLEIKDLLKTLDRIVGGVRIGVGRSSGDITHGT